ncbi:MULTISPECIES: hypothetical protein [unclassified Amycolatopsis]|uniref:hypothetical protein n=1 Tax=Amycolatopsis TaxID=1813 RepID=UPI00026255E5|nr:hypothetical protein [Amycolatopsis sp. ATCC 39116]
MSCHPAGPIVVGWTAAEARLRRLPLNLRVLAGTAIERNSTIVFPAQLMSSFRSLNSFTGSEMAGDGGEPVDHAR